MLRSLERNQDALIRWLESDPELKKTKKNRLLLQSIVNGAFWRHIREILEVLEPIHKIQVASESEGHPIYAVIRNWQLIRAHLKTPRIQKHLGDLAPTVDDKWASRFKLQTVPLHVAAYVLHPANQGTNMAGLVPEAEFMSQLGPLFKRYTSVPAEAMISYQNYHTGSVDFSSSSAAEQWKDDPKAYWIYHQGRNRSLAEFAFRLMITPSNSVPAERNFSIQNLIHTPVRNKLSQHKVNML
jgi:hypothetical protein